MLLVLHSGLCHAAASAALCATEVAASGCCLISSHPAVLDQVFHQTVQFSLQRIANCLAGVISSVGLHTDEEFKAFTPAEGYNKNVTYKNGTFCTAQLLLRQDAMLHTPMLCHAMPHHAVLCCAMLCGVMQAESVLCHFVPCFATMYRQLSQFMSCFALT